MLPVNKLYSPYTFGKAFVFDNGTFIFIRFIGNLKVICKIAEEDSNLYSHGAREIFKEIYQEKKWNSKISDGLKIISLKGK
jgi:hypothetical protein